MTTKPTSSKEEDRGVVLRTDIAKIVNHIKSIPLLAREEYSLKYSDGSGKDNINILKLKEIETRAYSEATNAIEKLIVEARIDELNIEYPIDVEDLGQSFLDGFNYAKDQLDEHKRYRIAQLKKGDNQ